MICQRPSMRATKKKLNEVAADEVGLDEHSHTGIPDEIDRPDRRLVVRPRPTWLCLDHREEVLDRNVRLHRPDVAHRPGVGMERFLQLADIAVGSNDVQPDQSVTSSRSLM